MYVAAPTASVVLGPRNGASWSTEQAIGVGRWVECGGGERGGGLGGLRKKKGRDSRTLVGS